MDVDDEGGDHEILLGHNIVEECSEQQCQKEKMRSWEPLTKNEINDIQKCLGAITRPTWHRGPPINLGDAAHGKLKAEQWRSSIEFDLPVTLFKKWGLDCDEDIQSTRRKKLAHSTMLLAMAVRWGMSHIISENHATRCINYMRAYLECVKDIFPDITLRPNHHAALHIHEFLLRYGPMHGWWMFPFEQIIRTLQKTKTNHKIG